jgi:hypothetical protein
MEKIILIIVIGYLISAFLAWKFISMSYSKKGRWSNINPTFADVWVVFCPLLNTIVSIIFLISGTKSEEYKKDVSGFFNIKK